MSRQSAAESRGPSFPHGENPPKESKIHDPYLRATLAVIYHSPDLGLSATEQAVLHQLIRFARRYKDLYPSRELLARYAGVSPATVRNASRRLKKKGLIRWKACGVPGKRSLRCVYDIAGVLEWANSPENLDLVTVTYSDQVAVTGSDQVTVTKEKSISTEKSNLSATAEKIADASKAAPRPYWEEKKEEQ